MADDKENGFCYRIKSNFSDTEEFIEVEKSYWKKSHNEKPNSKILKILIDGRNLSNALIKYMVDEGKRLLRKHKLKEVLIIIFYLDSHTEEDFEYLEKTVNPQELVNRIIDVSPDYGFNSGYSYLANKSNNF